jgi:hypothetical protein
MQATFSKNNVQYKNTLCQVPSCRVSHYFVVLNVIMINAIKLNVIMLSVMVPIAEVTLGAGTIKPFTAVIDSIQV